MIVESDITCSRSKWVQLSSAKLNSSNNNCLWLGVGYPFQGGGGQIDDHLSLLLTAGNLASQQKQQRSVCPIVHIVVGPLSSKH